MAEEVIGAEMMAITANEAKWGQEPDRGLVNLAVQVPPRSPVPRGDMQAGHRPNVPIRAPQRVRRMVGVKAVQTRRGDGYGTSAG